MGKWSSWLGLGAGSLCTASSGRLGAGLASLLCSTPALEMIEVLLSRLDLFLLGIVGVASSSDLEEELGLGGVLRAALLEETFTMTLFVLSARSLTFAFLSFRIALLLSSILKLMNMFHKFLNAGLLRSPVEIKL